MQYIGCGDDSVERAGPSLIVAASVVFEHKLARLTHEQRVHAAPPAVLLSLRQALADVLRRRLCEGATCGDRPGAKAHQQMPAIEIDHRSYIHMQGRSIYIARASTACSSTFTAGVVRASAMCSLSMLLVSTPQ